VNCTKLRLAAGLCPDTLGSYSAPDSLAVIGRRGGTEGGREGREGVERDGKGNGGWEGEGGSGRGGSGKGERVRLGYLSRVPEFLVTSLVAVLGQHRVSELN